MDTDTVGTSEMITGIYDVERSACLASSTTPSPRLYVTGGGSFASPLDTVQIYEIDTEHEQWLAEGPSMLNGRAAHGCIVVDDTLYVVGGGVAAVEAININHPF